MSEHLVNPYIAIARLAIGCIALFSSTPIYLKNGKRYERIGLGLMALGMGCLLLPF